MSKEKLLTITEAAKVLNLKAGTLRKWDREGKIKPLRIGTRNDRRYKESELLALLGKGADEKVRWQEYLRSNCPYHLVPPIFEGMAQGMKRYFGRGINNLITYYEGDSLSWCYNMADLYELGRVVIDKLTGSKSFEKKFFDTWDGKATKLFSFIEKNTAEKMKKINDTDLADVYEKYEIGLSDWYGLAAGVDATDETLMVDIGKRLKEIVQKKRGEKYAEKDFIEAYGALTTPSNLSYVNDERKMVLLIAQDVKNRRLKIDSQEFEKRAQAILKNFWWTGLGWGRSDIKTTFDIRESVEEVLKNKINISRELYRIKNYKSEVKKQKEKVEKEYHISKDKELFSWLKIMDTLVEYHDKRKEMQMKGVYWEYQLFDIISERKHVHRRLLDWAEPKDIIQFLRGGKFDSDEMNLRSAHFIWLSINGKEEKITGRAAASKHAEFFDSKIEETRDLQGMSASGGKAIGEAYVAIAYEKALQIKTGQILVTGMTTPEFVPAMRKAAAIVTDEGGITCHAAIISRELGIPCIVGTKMATKVIKNGDKIEVAANHGVVRILGN